MSFAEPPAGYGAYNSLDGGSVYSALTPGLGLGVASIDDGGGSLGMINVGEGGPGSGSADNMAGASVGLGSHSGMGLSYTEKGALRQKCRQLALIFRQVDFMLRDSLYVSLSLSLSLP